MKKTFTFIPAIMAINLGAPCLCLKTRDSHIPVCRRSK